MHQPTAEIHKQCLECPVEGISAVLALLECFRRVGLDADTTFLGAKLE